jgi:death on curing protein
VDEPLWVDRLVVDAIHFDLLAQHGGLRGLRDENALESALVRPRNKWAHDPDVDLPSLAAAYAYGIARNHPFNDGNKRMAFVVMYVFLGLNGLEINAPETEVVNAMIQLADHRLSDARLGDWVRIAVR